MDPEDLSSLGDIGSDGADLAVNPPDIQVQVAPSSFDFSTINTQDTVTGVYSPTGIPVGSYGADATLSTLANQCAIPTGTEDAIAYTANLDVSPTAVDTVAPTDFTNTATGGPVDANSAGTQATDPTAGSAQPSLGGVKDAVSGLAGAAALFSRVSGAVAAVANERTIAQRTPMPTLATQQRGGAPMTAPRNSSQAVVPVKGASQLSPATIALLVGGVGLILAGAIG